MLKEIRIPLTEEQGAMIEKTASAAGLSVDTVVQEAASSVLRCLNVSPRKASGSGNAERFVEAFFPEERWREVQARMTAEHWSVTVEG